MRGGDGSKVRQNRGHDCVGEIETGVTRWRKMRSDGKRRDEQPIRKPRGLDDVISTTSQGTPREGGPELCTAAPSPHYYFRCIHICKKKKKGICTEGSFRTLIDVFEGPKRPLSLAREALRVETGNSSRGNVRVFFLLCACLHPCVAVS